ncbi:MAG: STAS domain-containing protein [candidate division Zixibacteria bacterium]|nr:STAS domain-containing protein [candidate division Zixibacteria bacterium]
MEACRFEHRVLHDDVFLINPGRILDNSNAHEMVHALTGAQADGFRYVVLDMTALEFLSSAGVGSLLGSVDLFREQGGDIILCHVPEPIMHILRVLDLADFFTIKSDTRQAAVACGKE